MFEDLCLTCGKDVPDGRAYCNDVCQNGDLTSPSLSGASSPFESPHLAYAHGQDVPALVPSALGRALRAYTAHDRYSASSSSASSTSWSSVVTDDEDMAEYAREPDVAHASYKGLSYARRPSGTNNRSTFPHLLHRRTDSSESTAFVCSLPQSAPSGRLCSPDVDDDEYVSDFDHASEDPSRPHTATITASSAPAKAHRKRNRASLPAYFSILQMGASTASTAAAAAALPHASPISSSSGHTLSMRPSPPTPRLSLMTGLAAAHAHALTAPPTPQYPHVQSHHTHATPRGRRRESAGSPTRLRSASRRPCPSSSRSPSPARRRDSDEKVADWSSALARTRGRAVRRNSSPPAEPIDCRVFAAAAAATPPRSGSGSASRARTRGRARVSELDGPGSPERPGFGAGRSGLIARAARPWAGVVPL